MYGRNGKCLQNFGWEVSSEGRDRWEENIVKAGIDLNGSWKCAAMSCCGHSVEHLWSINVGDLLMS
jgi:hypothetical protein